MRATADVRVKSKDFCGFYRRLAVAYPLSLFPYGVKKQSFSFPMASQRRKKASLFDPSFHLFRLGDIKKPGVLARFHTELCDDGEMIASSVTLCK